MANIFNGKYNFILGLCVVAFFTESWRGVDDLYYKIIYKKNEGTIKELNFSQEKVEYSKYNKRRVNYNYGQIKYSYIVNNQKIEGVFNDFYTNYALSVDDKIPILYNSNNPNESFLISNYELSKTTSIYWMLIFFSITYIAIFFINKKMGQRP